MRSSENPAARTRSGSVSLILPLVPGRTLPSHEVARFRQVLEEKDSFDTVEVVMTRGADAGSPNSDAESDSGRLQAPRSNGKDVRHIVVEGQAWGALAQSRGCWRQPAST